MAAVLHLERIEILIDLGRECECILQATHHDADPE
jgi:hypothetical protein